MACEIELCPFTALQQFITLSNKCNILELFDDQQVAHILDHLWNGGDPPPSRNNGDIAQLRPQSAELSSFSAARVHHPVSEIVHKSACAVARERTSAMAHNFDLAMVYEPDVKQQTVTSFVSLSPVSTSSSGRRSSRSITNILHPFPDQLQRVQSRASTFAEVVARGVPAPMLTPPIYHQFKRSYARHFNPDGTHIFPITHDSHGNRVLPDSRGVFFKNIPLTADLTSIAKQLRGGAIERIDFHRGRPTLGVYFVLAVDAARYIKATRQILGPSTVEAIPRIKGGHEPIKINVAKAIREEGATRVLRVTGLPEDCRGEALVKHVRRQSHSLEIEIESVEWSWDPEGRKCCVIRMASIGTALGARLQLRKLKYYRGCGFEFLRDECEGSLDELRSGWIADMRSGNYEPNRMMF